MLVCSAMPSGLRRDRNPRASVVQTARLLGGKVLNVDGGKLSDSSSICSFLPLSRLPPNKLAVAIIGIKELRSGLCCQQTREQSQDQSLFRAGLRAFEPQ